MVLIQCHDDYHCFILENLAFGKQTDQISLRLKDDGTEGGASSRAVDGNSATVFSSRSCTHTKTENKAWWRVDLGQVEPVSEVYIVNIAGRYSFRLDSFEIRVGRLDFPILIQYNLHTYTTDCSTCITISVCKEV